MAKQAEVTAQQFASIGVGDHVVERRKLVSEIAVLVLLGVAFGEMARSMSATLDSYGITINDVSLFVIFFTTAIRFAIGDHLYINSAIEGEQTWAWLVDFTAIALAVVLLIFLGSETSLGGLHSKFSFIDILLTLYAVDFMWIVFTVMAQQQSEHRVEAPRAEWLMLDIVLAAVVLAVRYLPGPGSKWGLPAMPSSPATWALPLLATASLVVFVVDLAVMSPLLGDLAKPSTARPQLGRPKLLFARWWSRVDRAANQ